MDGGLSQQKQKSEFERGTGCNVGVKVGSSFLGFSL